MKTSKSLKSKECDHDQPRSHTSKPLNTRLKQRDVPLLVERLVLMNVDMERRAAQLEEEGRVIEHTFTDL